MKNLSNREMNAVMGGTITKRKDYVILDAPTQFSYSWPKQWKVGATVGDLDVLAEL